MGNGTGFANLHRELDVYNNSDDAINRWRRKMKKCILFVLFWGVQFVNGQSYWTQQGNDIYYNSGNVGIGTITPQTRLDVHDGNIRIFKTGWPSLILQDKDTDELDVNYTGTILFNDKNGSETGWLGYGSSGNNDFSIRNSLNSKLRFYTNSELQMIISEEGNVGIGTPDPTFTIGKGLVISHSNAGLKFNTTADGGWGFTEYSKNDAVKFIAGYRDSDESYRIISGTTLGSSNGIIVTNNGSVGIGNANPAPSTYKLAVSGKIGATEIEVKQNIPDYVFEKEYNLRSLGQVEAFIKEEGHLPDIPSAKEFEGRRVAIGEMQEKHLQKIEELTLYLIEQNKMLQQQANKIAQLEQKLEEIQHVSK